METQQNALRRRIETIRLILQDRGIPTQVCGPTLSQTCFYARAAKAHGQLVVLAGELDRCVVSNGVAHERLSQLEIELCEVGCFS